MTDCESPGMFLLVFEPDRVSTTQEHSKDAEDLCLPSCGAGCDRRTRWCPRHRCLTLPVLDRLLRAFFGKIVAGSDGRRNVDYRPSFLDTRIRDLDLDPWVREYVDTFACPPGLTYPGIQA